jgi:hypothetical protein
VLGFVAALSLASAALFGFLPALRLARFREGVSMARTAKATIAGHALATTQLALATMLLICSGLLLHSFAKLVAVDMGFHAQNARSFELVMPGAYSPDRKIETAEALVARLRGHPQVARVGVTDIAPLTPGIMLGGGLLPVGSSAEDARLEASLPVGERTQQRYDGAEYLRALGARLLSGRWLDADSADPPRMAALVTRPYAERYFPSGNALGARIQSTLGVLTIVVCSHSGAVSGTRFWKNELPSAPCGKRCISVGRPPATARSGSATAR